MAKKGNKRKKSFLDNIPQISINSKTDTLAKRCKFNFSYFVNSDEAGQDFKDWEYDELVKLLNKLKDYSNNSLEYWKTQKAGRYSVLEIYGSFPKNSDFKEPQHIPVEAQWARFHLENIPRLIGFVIPDSYHDIIQNYNGYRFDKNTFYIVFLDKYHNFYKIKK